MSYTTNKELTTQIYQLKLENGELRRKVERLKDENERLVNCAKKRGIFRTLIRVYKGFCVVLRAEFSR